MAAASGTANDPPGSRIAHVSPFRAGEKIRVTPATPIESKRWKRTPARARRRARRTARTHDGNAAGSKAAVDRYRCGGIRRGSATARIVLALALVALFICPAGAASAHVIDPPVNILPAGTVPAMLSLTVTGTVVGPRFLARAIDAELDRLIRPTLQPGATISYGPLAPALQSLSPGYVSGVQVAVTISGVGLATVNASTMVNLTNLPLAPASPSILFFDDDPEYVPAPGMLSRSRVELGQAATLYYYHDVAGAPLDIAVVLTAAGATTSRVQLIAAGAGPDPDVMSVGADVSRTFLRDTMRNAGIVTDVAPGAPFVLRDRLTLHGELVAGAIDVRVLMGGPVTVAVEALPAGADPVSAPAAAFVPRDGHHRFGRFDISDFGADTIAYTAGGPDAGYVLGGKDRSPSSAGSGGNDDGDYGAVQHIVFDVDNPLRTAQPLYLFEQPRGGAVRGTFVVNGRMLSLGCARLPQRYLIASDQLPPLSQSIVTVTTTTDGGSNYPLMIGLTQVPPIPVTPPISATDGCFPKASPSPEPAPALP
jgi:hypothetical protein